MPRYRFLKKNYDLTSFSFFDKFYLNKQISLDFNHLGQIFLLLKKKFTLKKLIK